MNTHISTSVLILVTALAGSFWVSCSKTNSVPPTYSVASLNVVDALPNSAPLILVQGSISSAIGDFSNIDPLSYASTAVLTPMSGAEAFYTVQQNGDTASVSAQGGDFMFSGTLTFTAGSLYSLFITGEDTTNPDFLFVKDVLPVITDSSVGIRFVNLSAGSNAVSVDIQGQSNGGVVSSLAYKSIATFQKFPATSLINSYIFEFRDATSGNLLASYTLDGVNSVLFKNLTIALIGQPAGGTVAQTCIQENNF
jgi:hypothetical protein